MCYDSWPGNQREGKSLRINIRIEMLFLTKNEEKFNFFLIKFSVFQRNSKPNGEYTMLHTL